MSNMQYDKQAILKTLEYLKNNEPSCSFCEQCEYGYKYDNESISLCKQRNQIKEKEHKIWENKILKWKERLKNAK